MATNRLRHFNGCSIEELEPSHLQPRDECPAIDGLSCCGVGTCGHMRPPSKGWIFPVHRGSGDAESNGGENTAPWKGMSGSRPLQIHPRHLLLRRPDLAEPVQHGGEQ